MQASDLQVAANPGLHCCRCEEQGDENHAHRKVGLLDQHGPWLIAQSLYCWLESEQYESDPGVGGPGRRCQISFVFITLL